MVLRSASVRVMDVVSEQRVDVVLRNVGPRPGAMDGERAEAVEPGASQDDERRAVLKRNVGPLRAKRRLSTSPIVVAAARYV